VTEEAEWGGGAGKLDKAGWERWGNRVQDEIEAAHGHVRGGIGAGDTRSHQVRLISGTENLRG
jgi:hypothetical protein